MKFVTNVRGRRLEIAETGQVVGPGETVEVDDLLAARLCEQPANWREGTDRPKPGKQTGRKQTGRRSATKENS